MLSSSIATVVAWMAKELLLLRALVELFWFWFVCWLFWEELPGDPSFVLEF